MRRLANRPRGVSLSTQLITVAFVGFVAFFAGTPTASALVAEVTSYLKQFQFGLDYSNSYDNMTVSYQMPRQAAMGADCKPVVNQGDRQTCAVSATAGSSSGYGIVLERAFKRQGFWYFRPDVGFGARYLNAAVGKADLARHHTQGLPLTGMSASLAALIIKPYVQVGITPASSWPDLMLSLGPAIQMALGRATINDTSANVAFITSSGSLITGFVALELVLWRFGNGSLSLFSSNDYSGDGRGSQFFPKAVDGMDDIRAKFDRRVGGMAFGFGAKVLFPW